jgi:cytochrome c oxidase accessory protein FixG
MFTRCTDQTLRAQKPLKAKNKNLRINVVSLNEFELHADRLSTTDASGKRIFLQPADVRGFFRRRRTQVEAVLIVFFLLLPWFRIQGRQALLLNLPDRRFEIFGLSLRAHNAPLLIYVLAAAAFALFFTTTVFGRIWCGWACPQTVFIDGVFRRIERWIEGPALERRKLDKQSITLKKISKRITKWFFFTLATLVITHSFLAYFVGTEHLARMMRESPTENWGTFLFMCISSAAILFNFGWFREQFCTIICPYGRFQSVLMDKGSMIVAYDVERGEPRASIQAKALAKTHQTKLGDCVNCYRCVQVCPTGIDIRRGLQMECIACTACADACDEVMTKVKKPTGLIRYDSLLGLEAKKPMKRHWSPRAFIYLALFFVSVSALAYSVAHISPVEVSVLRAKDAPYTTEKQSDGTTIVVNHLKVEMSNQSGASQLVRFSALTDGNVVLNLITATQPLPIADGKVMQADVFIRFPQSLLKNGQKTISIRVESEDHRLTIDREVNLVGPFS